VFGELTRAFFDGKLELTAGLRHFEDTVGQRHLGNASDDPPPAGLGPDAQDRFDATTPRVILNWHASADTTAYLSYAEGFRSGLHQNPVIRRALPDVPVTQPDTLKNYEIGLKGGFFGNRLVYDAAVYYMDWQDVQLPLSLNIEGIGRVLLVNGASASGMGVDWSLTARPISRLELGANLSWNDIQVDSDVYSNNIRLFQKGDRLNSSIQTTAGASASYSFGLGARREGSVSVSGTYRSRATSRALLGTDVVSNKSDPILIARAAFEVDSGQRWSAMLFVDNIANEQGSTFRASANPGVVDAQYPRPRTIGFHVDYRL
jgi:outer membrane receptor protein involved in Fe transport